MWIYFFGGHGECFVTKPFHEWTDLFSFISTEHFKTALMPFDSVLCVTLAVHTGIHICLWTMNKPYLTGFGPDRWFSVLLFAVGRTLVKNREHTMTWHEFVFWLIFSVSLQFKAVQR
jgi:hypothetical protein